jgi:hypothetical protein
MHAITLAALLQMTGTLAVVCYPPREISCQKKDFLLFYLSGASFLTSRELSRRTKAGNKLQVE